MRMLCLAVTICAGCGSGGLLSSPPEPAADLQTAGPLAPPAKTGSYTGPMTDPQLTTEADCSDATLEPNDTLATAIDLQPLALSLDGPAGVLQSLAICPSGPNPRSPAGGHDVDVYRLTLTQSGYAIVLIDYDVTEGDLDLGLYTNDGALLVGDGTAVSNACVVSMLGAGTYFIGVFGANGVDSNRYTMSVRYASAEPACPL